MQPEISVVVPARNEAENLTELLPEIAGILFGHAYEIVVVDDGTQAVVKRLAADNPHVRLLGHPSPLGKSAALWTGVTAARAEIIVTLDGDGQNDPQFILALVAPLSDAAVGLVAGQRIGRQSSRAKKIGSRIANRVRRAFLAADDTHDTACGAKAFRRDVFLHFPFFATVHRFLPALALGDGWRMPMSMSLTAPAGTVDRTTESSIDS